VRRALILGALAALTACGNGVSADSQQLKAKRAATARRPAEAARPPLTWPPAEPWIAPPSASQGSAPVFDWPTPTPAPPPDGQHHAAGSPFAPLARGYDASYPQCASPQRPTSAAYGIVGVNNGRAFTLNPCFPTLLAAAPKGAEIYLNTGFNPGNAGRMVPGCALRAGALPGADAQQRLAYGLGCSTTVDTLDVLRLFKIAYPSVWWLDVEEANSWDDARPDVNRYSLLGQIDVLAATGRTIGVYSTFPDWQQITGGLWGDSRIAADWVAGKSPQDACSHPGFSGAPVWLAQELATWPGSGYDSDYAC
jgi:hypothetical protein